MHLCMRVGKSKPWSLSTIYICFNSVIMILHNKNHFDQVWSQHILFIIHLYLGEKTGERERERQREMVRKIKSEEERERGWEK